MTDLEIKFLQAMLRSKGVHGEEEGVNQGEAEVVEVEDIGEVV
jgi:hypothetical protein